MASSGEASADRAMDREAWLGLDEGGQPATQYRMIVDDEKPLCRAGSVWQAQRPWSRPRAVRA